MRKILFRGKQTDNGEWVEGYFIHAEDIYKPDNEITSFIVEKDTAYFGYNEFSGAMRVIPETVGQYTGLKDKNGTKIFEGDIVKIGSETIKWKCNHQVVFEEGQWFYFHKEISTKSYIGAWGNSIVEVIGNIHDNPELLEV